MFYILINVLKHSKHSGINWSCVSNTKRRRARTRVTNIGIQHYNTLLPTCILWYQITKITVIIAAVQYQISFLNSYAYPNILASEPFLVFGRQLTLK